MLAIGTSSNTKVWDLSSGKLLQHQMGGSDTLSFSNDGKIFLLIDGGTMSLWDVENGTFHERMTHVRPFAIDRAPTSDAVSAMLHSLTSDAETAPPIKSVAFSRDDKSLLVMTANWVHLLQIEPSSLRYVASRVIGNWETSIFLDDTGKNIRFFLRSPEGTLKFKDARFDDFEPAKALAGEPKKLLEEWQNRLAVTIDSGGYLTPKWLEGL